LHNNKKENTFSGPFKPCLKRPINLSFIKLKKMPPILGAILSAALSGIFGIGATMAANKYNSPKAQKRRLREAGLPLAYMYQGKVNQQSSVPQLSIDPTLGTLPAIQAKKLKEDTQLADTQEEALSKDIQVGDIIPEGENKSNRLIKKEAEAFLAKYEADIKKIELDVERGAFAEGTSQEMKRQALIKAKQQVENLLAQAGLMEQLKKIRGFEEYLNTSLTQDLKDMPQWIAALLKILLIATKRK